MLDFVTFYILGTNSDFCLNVLAIQKVIPQEEYIMLRYTNESNTLSTLAIWCEDYRKRDALTNEIIIILSNRTESICCDPYSDSHKLASSKDFTPSSSSAKQREKLLQILSRPSSCTDLMTDADIANRSQFTTKSNNTSSTSLLKQTLGLSISDINESNQVTNDVPFLSGEQTSATEEINSIRRIYSDSSQVAPVFIRRNSAETYFMNNIMKNEL